MDASWPCLAGRRGTYPCCENGGPGDSACTTTSPCFQVDRVGIHEYGLTTRQLSCAGSCLSRYCMLLHAIIGGPLLCTGSKPWKQATQTYTKTMDLAAELATTYVSHPGHNKADLD